MGKLYVVGTPIGNLEDLTPRAARILGEVSLIAAEDTRVTRRLLSHLGIHVPMVSYNEHNQHQRLPALLADLGSGDLALVTDAGMPAVSDPGSDLVAQAAAAGFQVEAVPGVSAVTTALSMSGMSGDGFLFLGFLPRKARERRAKLEGLTESTHTLVVFEAPHRLKATLRDILAVLGEREMSVCRELTKLYEEVFRGTASEALAHFREPRGEFVLVIRGVTPTAAASGPTDDQLEEAGQRLESLRKDGVRAKDAVAQVSDALGMTKNRVYQMWVESGRTTR
ncbi:MAG: 16S rRNA (cytidine(1402)-2'-O)-methyltransferase [Dehalococcoidia bacterium]|nr:16S rRNA (cytidine(1402)-2'-O)-methyltransferase [Dehalococcoidia bacterium]